MSSKKITLNEDHLDFLVELFTVGAGKSSEILSEMLNTYIRLSIPMVKQIDVSGDDEDIPDYLNQEVSVIDLLFKGDVSGESKLIFPAEIARKLGNLLMDAQEDEDFDSAKIGVLTEVGNIVLNSIMGTISNYLNISFDYQIPIFQTEFTKSGIQHMAETHDTILLADTRFTADEHEISGNIAILFTMDSMKGLTRLMEKHLEEL
ncbi:MAG: hypothetical protein PQJ58_04950 [Spirochaetales bacterium]|nr:hypothetical protein [Spirochaetales bacterium]